MTEKCCHADVRVGIEQLASERLLTVNDHTRAFNYTDELGAHTMLTCCDDNLQIV